MILVIIAIVILFVFSYIDFIDECDLGKVGTFVGSIILTGFFMLILWPAISLILLGISIQYSHEEVKYETYELQALTIDKSFNVNGDGAFFLGIGSVEINGNTSNVYKYYIKKDGAFILKEVESNKSKIYTDIKDEQPFVVEELHYNTCDDGKDSIFFPLREWSANCMSNGNKEYTYSFHIPENSIIQTYEINLNGNK